MLTHARNSPITRKLWASLRAELLQDKSLGLRDLYLAELAERIAPPGACYIGADELGDVLMSILRRDLASAQGALMKELEDRRRANSPKGPTGARQQHALGATMRARASAQSLGLSVAEYEQAKRCFIQYDKDCSGTLDREELERLFGELLVLNNHRVDDNMVKVLAKRHFDEADVDGNKQLDFEEFVTIYQQILRVYDVAK